ncbi:MAG TPA: hypothetical protein VKA64_10065 [Gammaproteobacteria bacterium]|nr:hypothetical protein [Gammaproteobacteria bacterium]
MRLTHSFHVPAALLLALAAKPIAAAPELPAPPDSRVTPITAGSALHGMRTTVRRFVSEKSVDGVLRYYRQLWRRPHDEIPGYLEHRIGPWHMITRVENEHLLSVQVQPMGGKRSRGNLAVSQIADETVRAAGRGRFPMMHGSTVINDLPSDDAGKRGRTLLLANNFTVSANAQYYTRHYRDRGWEVALDASGDRNNTRVLDFQRTGAEAKVTIHATENGSAVVANIVEY